MTNAKQNAGRSVARTNANWLLSSVAAAAVATLFAAPAMAQYRVGSDGHANDVNNRIGSAGLNDSRSTGPVVNGGNNVVTGNITGGRQFRGFVPYTDPYAFRGATSGTNVDNFTRTSAGVPIGVYNNNNAGNVLPYYGDSRGITPPPQFQQQAPGQVGYTPAPLAGRGSGDLRLGNPFVDSVTSDQPRPGQLVLPGPIDQTNQQSTVITASPLYGIRQWNPGNSNDDQFLSSYTDVYSNQRRTGQLDAGALARMRNELSADQARPDAQLQNGALQNQNLANNPNGTNGNANGNANGNGPDHSNNQNATPDMNRPLNRPVGDQGTNGEANGGANGGGASGTTAGGGANQPLDSSISGQPLSNGLATNQGFRNRVLSDKPLPPIAGSSARWRELKERYDAAQAGGANGANGMADVNTARENNEMIIAQRKAAAAGGANGGANGGTASGNTPGMTTPGMTTPGMTSPGMTSPGMTSPGVATPGGTPAVPGMGTAPGGAAPGAVEPSGIKPPDAMPGAASATPRSGDLNKPRPVQINSLAKDMKASQAADLMKEAEEYMRNGKYTSALDKYDMIDQVSPNDPLVSLGRATAELGASYYSRADAHLREAFTRNPQLLMGQYDLHTFLGDDRLQYLVKDLKGIDKGDAKQTRAVFLLAYIAYNTGNERNAAAYLDLADKRSGGRDPFFKLIRQHWALPENAAPTEELNK